MYPSRSKPINPHTPDVNTILRQTLAANHGPRALSSRDHRLPLPHNKSVSVLPAPPRRHHIAATAVVVTVGRLGPRHTAEASGGHRRRGTRGGHLRLRLCLLRLCLPRRREGCRRAAIATGGSGRRRRGRRRACRSISGCGTGGYTRPSSCASPACSCSYSWPCSCWCSRGGGRRRRRHGRPPPCPCDGGGTAATVCDRRTRCCGRRCHCRRRALSASLACGLTSSSSSSSIGRLSQSSKQ